MPETALPTKDDPAIKEAADRERRAALLRKGRASTLLTDQNTLGDPLLAKRSLLGG
jgi:hypothetical protein